MDDILNLKPNIIIGDFKEGTLTLNAWKDFQSRQGPYASKDTNEKSNGTVKVVVAGCEVDYVKISSQAQINSIQYLSDNSKLIHDEILRQLIVALSDLKSIYGEYLPSINNAEEFQKHMGLSTIHVMTPDKDDFAYVGFEFGCTWDEEHGLGVMTHKARVISIGQADKSFDIWPTYADNGTEAEMTVKWDQDHKHLKRSKWKFWK
jgi:hypothetical protein